MYLSERSGEFGLGIAPAAVGAAVSAVSSLFGGGGPPWQKSYDETKAAIKKGDWATVANKTRSQFPKVSALASKALAQRAQAEAVASAGAVASTTPTVALAGALDTRQLAMYAIGGVVLYVLSRRR